MKAYERPASNPMHGSLVCSVPHVAFARTLRGAAHEHTLLSTKGASASTLESWRSHAGMGMVGAAQPLEADSAAVTQFAKLILTL